MKIQVRWRRQRRSLLLKALDNYPATPAGYYTGYYPGSKAVESFRTEFNRKHQNLPELNSYPSAVADVVVTAWDTHFEKTRRTRYKLQKTELNSYPETPAGYYTGHYPGSKAVEILSSSFDVELQQLPELNQYPSAPVSTPGEYPAHVLLKANKTKFARKRQVLPELNSYPATSAEYYTGYYPGSKAVESLRTEFDIKIQEVELNEHPPTPVSGTGDFPAFVLIQASRMSFSRTLQEVPVFDGYVAETGPTGPGMQYTLPENRLEYALPENRLQYTLPENKLEYN